MSLFSRVRMAWPPLRRRRPVALSWQKATAATATATATAATALFVVAPSDGADWRRHAKRYGSSAKRFGNTSRAMLETLADYKWVLWQIERGKMPEDEMTRCHERAAVRMAQCALENGGLYIKLGQTIGSLNNVLPPQYIEGLRALQDCAYPRGWEEVVQTLVEEFGKTPDELFVEFERKPVGAASLAQVHRAKTVEGDEVAVKVQYADLRERFEGDLATMRLMLDWVTVAFPKFEFAWILRSFQDTLRLEMDFENEAANSRRCAGDLVDLPGVTVPKVYDKYTSKRVLTDEFIHGCKANDRKAIEAMGLDVATVASLIIKTFCKQIFGSGFVHSDPHAGNILVRKTKDNMPEIVILDHGLYIEVSEHDRELFGEFWSALVLGNDDRLREVSNLLGVDNHHLFASMMMQRPYVPPDATAGFFAQRGIQLHLTPQDIERIQEQAREKMDEMVRVLKTMPRALVLVIRNLNLVRSLNRELGAPVNRFELMARAAMKYAPVSTGGGFWQTTWRRVWFEIRLQWVNMRNWFQDLAVSFLTSTGVLPPAVVEFVEPA